MLVEQAIFTSARTERLDGYQLVAATEGISTADCQSLTQWCPAHDSLAERSGQATSVNFHPLSSENHCISRTMVAGAEYSGRGGGRIFTQCFVVSPEILAKFSNNPLRILEAISASGHIRHYDEIPNRLEPFRLLGRASVIDRSLLKRVQSESLWNKVMAVIEAVIGNQSVCIIDQRDSDLWLGVLFSLLPVACRTQLSFCTGLEFSGRRPFRCQTRWRLEGDLRKSSLRQGVTLLDMDATEDSASESLDGWPHLIRQMSGSDKLAVMERLLGCRLPGLRIDDLDALANEMLHDQRAGNRPFELASSN